MRIIAIVTVAIISAINLNRIKLCCNIDDSDDSDDVFKQARQIILMTFKDDGDDDSDSDDVDDVFNQARRMMMVTLRTVMMMILMIFSTIHDKFH